MANTTHGLEITERPTSLIAPIVSQSAIQIVVGVAPVHLAEDKEDPLRPKLAYSYDEAVRKLGFSSDLEAYPICQSMVASFQIYNVSPVIFINVLDPKKHSGEGEEVVVFKGKKVRLAGHGISINTLKVMSMVGDTEYPPEHYDLEIIDPENIWMSLKPEAGVIPEDGLSLKLTYACLDPGLVTEDDIVTGIAKIREIHPLHSLVPCTLICPGWSHLPKVYSAMIAQSDSLNGCFRYLCISDIDTETVPSYDLCKVEKDKNNIVSPECIAVWPMVKNGSRIFYQSVILAAHMAYVDYLNDGVPYNSPSNKNYRISGLCDRVGKEIILDMEQGNLLNTQGILTAINFNGWKCWGNRTAVYPSSSDVKDVFIPVRRMFNWWCNTFILTYFQKVDDPMNRKLIESIIDSENIRANGFKSRYQIAGAGVEFRLEDNPETDLISGIIRLKMWLTPFPPAEVIKSTIEFNVSALSASLAEGGS